MDNESGAELGLEPCGLRGHDVAAVGDSHELVHADRIESEGERHLAGIDTTLELSETTDTADEVDALVAAEIGDADQVAQNQIRRNSHIEHTDLFGKTIPQGTQREKKL